MAYRKVILAEAQQEYRDIVGYLVSMLRSEQAAAWIRVRNAFLHIKSGLAEFTVDSRCF